MLYTTLHVLPSLTAIKSSPMTSVTSCRLIHLVKYSSNFSRSKTRGERPAAVPLRNDKLFSDGQDFHMTSPAHATSARPDESSVLTISTIESYNHRKQTINTYIHIFTMVVTNLVFKLLELDDSPLFKGTQAAGCILETAQDILEYYCLRS
jgi:hypothetical protein